jgi:hemoglobin
MNTVTPTTMATPPHGLLQSPHFAMLGGEAVVVNLVEAFYRHMDARPDTGVIRTMHAPDLASTKEVLVRFLCEWLGGPKAYSAQHGHPRLRMRHASFAIGEAERDAWLACMDAALSDVGAESALHTALMASFFKTANFLRNTGPNPFPPATIPTTTKESP